ncbi:D-alanyl-D-alanine carboxypeptidase family protein [Nocardioides sp. CER19]|uniref:D-alanyl-D-alanine carboxypeptidase family protein n=1 Tax=Nocardioides sp. CER19 TaxID=3038538 RepID=UPI00244C0CFA|nr:D-alanyl-D-alanine carboxypeptidase family protein [Nocardioides sp. CER19]MDH2415953.1 D-alanyl-D-alanine carboxypeptidase family protein [Nocardioides sp. CER19]
MSSSHSLPSPARSPIPRPRRRVRPALVATLVAAPVIVGAAAAGVLGHQSLGTSLSTASSPIASAPLPIAPAPIVERHRTVGIADGVVPDGTTVFGDVPAVARLEPALLDALRAAAADAREDGVTFHVNSGWRDRAYQEQLFREAVAKYGSKDEAARWVARPGTSVHEAGEAVDIGPSDATAWLSRHGAAYGLCEVYRNEPWHFERRRDAVDNGCPATYADPTHDPRMQR